MESNAQLLQAKAKERTVKTQTIEYDLFSLISKINKGTIKINPSYQRRHRWDDKTSSRLIESLLLNIPVPTIYLSQDVDIDEEHEGRPTFSVIDGQQRLTAIQSFLENKLVLVGLETLEELNDLRYEELPNFLKRRLEDRSLTCLRIDSTVDSQVKYDIFERLNSGSVKLNPQELRNAIYGGPFNLLLQELAESSIFLELTHITLAKINKMDDLELVLRFFALTDDRYLNYKPLMKEYLDLSMKDFSMMDSSSYEELKSRFNNVMQEIKNVFGVSPFVKRGDRKKHSFSTAVFDAVCIVTDNFIRNNYGFRSDADNRFTKLFDDKEFDDSISGSINDKNKLIMRVQLLEKTLRR